MMMMFLNEKGNTVPNYIIAQSQQLHILSWIPNFMEFGYTFQVGFEMMFLNEIDFKRG